MGRREGTYQRPFEPITADSLGHGQLSYAVGVI